MSEQKFYIIKRYEFQPEIHFPLPILFEGGQLTNNSLVLHSLAKNYFDAYHDDFNPITTVRAIDKLSDPSIIRIIEIAQSDKIISYSKSMAELLKLGGESLGNVGTPLFKDMLNFWARYTRSNRDNS